MNSEKPVILPLTQKNVEEIEKNDEIKPGLKTYKLIICIVGLIGSFVIYGLLQERIMTIPYGIDQKYFNSSSYIVLSNRIIAILGALVVLLYNKEQLKPHAPLYKFLMVALFNTTSTYCQWESLKYVSFPTQTLGKCGKTIPVLIIGTLFAGKKYKLDDYISCIAITIGCTIFVLTGVRKYKIFTKINGK